MSAQYGIGSMNLTERWLDLVQNGHVVATTTISNPKASVQYGIRTVELDDSDDDTKKKIACMEFVQEIGNERHPQHPLVQQINATLSRLQSSISSKQQARQDQQYAVQYQQIGPYAAQLQLVRTLRPPPSTGFGTGGGEPTTCHPPPYDSTKDSFVQGPYRLALRPLVGSLSNRDLPPSSSLSSSSLTTAWDIYHNVSPADSRGHYLLIPTVSQEKTNWRGQILTRKDCQDVMILTQAIRPVGSALICYNSVGAGASQNHIHLHLWPSPPIPLLFDEHENNCNNGWNCYAVSKAKPISTITLFHNDGNDVHVSVLEYPVCCIKLSSTSTTNLGIALAKVVDIVQEQDAPHNVGLLNRPHNKHEDNATIAAVVDAYVFVRSRERSPRIVPGSRAGVSEMMGVFHTSSEDQFQELISDNDAMETVLRDVSYEPRDGIWEEIQSRLMNKKYNFLVEQ